MAPRRLGEHLGESRRDLRPAELAFGLSQGVFGTSSEKRSILGKLPDGGGEALRRNCLANKARLTIADLLGKTPNWRGDEGAPAFEALWRKPDWLAST